MTSHPTVSVVVIFYNAAPFLAEAVDSVVAQTYSDWELLLVDDGSTDGSTAIAQQYVAAEPRRVKYLQHPGRQNLGMSATRNRGLTEARGAFVAFLDADDFWHPDKLERQVALLDANPSAGLVAGRKEYWYSWSGEPADATRDFIQPLDLPMNTLVEPPAVLVAFLKNEYSCLLDILIRRTAIEVVGGYELAFRNMHEDQVFHAKLCMRFPVFVADHSWCRYRQHSTSFIAKPLAPQVRNDYRKRFLDWVRRYADEHGVVDRALGATLRSESFAVAYPRFTQARQRFWKFRQRLLGRPVPRLPHETEA